MGESLIRSGETAVVLDAESALTAVREQYAPDFLEILKRFELSGKTGKRVFISSGSGTIQGEDRKGRRPSIYVDHPKDPTRGRFTTIERGDIWADSQEELEVLMAAGPSKPLFIQAREEVKVTVNGLTEPALSEALSGNPLVDRQTGGLNLSDPLTPYALAYLIASMIVRFNAQSMQDLVAEGFLHPSLFEALKGEWEMLFRNISTCMAPLTTEGIPPEIRETLFPSLLAASLSIVRAFLGQHSKRIYLLQIARGEIDYTKRILGILEAAERAARK